MTPSHVHTAAERDGGRLAPLLLTSLVGGAAVFGAGLLLAQIDPGNALFFSWVFLLPVLVGAAMGSLDRPASHAAGVFVVAYLADLVHDWVVTGGDQVFHAALAVITGAIAALAATVARRTRRDPGVSTSARGAGGSAGRRPRRAAGR
jgi:peptidoglycan/LPS O-acetylase OafA/YrhL